MQVWVCVCVCVCVNRYLLRKLFNDAVWNTEVYSPSFIYSNVHSAIHMASISKAFVKVYQEHMRKKWSSNILS
jgi:hypothetical protein